MAAAPGQLDMSALFREQQELKDDIFSLRAEHEIALATLAVREKRQAEQCRRLRSGAQLAANTEIVEAAHVVRCLQDQIEERRRRLMVLKSQLMVLLDWQEKNSCQ